jgi:hypothetical protein
LLAEKEDVSNFDAKLGRLACWQWSGSDIALGSDDVLAGARRIFWIADGRGNPIDQLEALKPWLKQGGLELARIFCVVNCQLAEKHPALLQWYDACVHFSDVVLLARREGVANKWMSDFRRRYEDKHFPCLIELVKQGRVKNPALVLEPEARRMSQYFDATPWDELDLEDVEIGIDDDEEPIDKDDLDDDEDDGDAPPPTDPYFEQRAGGRRVIELPDICKYLG